MSLRDLLRSFLKFCALTSGAALMAGEIPLCESQRLCPEKLSPSTWCMTSKFWFEAEFASGASGDVVAVTITLHYAPAFDFEFNHIELVVCHDPSNAELVGGPVYSEEFLARDPLMATFVPVREDRSSRQKGYGWAGIFGPLVDRSPVVGVLPILTVYYRLIGLPGETSEVSFCDGEFLKWGPGDCHFSGIDDTRILPAPSNSPFPSTRNVNGTLTIVEGPATHPDRPPEPPEAVVYPEVPASEEVNLRVRIGNGFALPGDRAVPIDVFVTADVEYTAVVVPIDFDERYLRVARIEDHFLAGAAPFDNEDAVPGSQPEEGYVIIASSLFGKRRIAPAGREFHAATLYLDVLEAAAEIASTTLEARSVGGRAPHPYIVVRHLSGDAAERVEVRGEFGGGEIDNGVLAIRASLETLPGDANFDGRFDISDPISVLGYLFLGAKEPLCRPAADYDGDGQLVITDPIRMLNVQFSGEGPPDAGDGGLVGCR